MWFTEIRMETEGLWNGTMYIFTVEEIWGYLLQIVWRIIARSLTLALDPNMELPVGYSPSYSGLPGKLLPGLSSTKVGNVCSEKLVLFWQCSSGVLQALGPLCFIFALILAQVYNTIDSTTSPLPDGKRRVGKACQFKGMAWKHEQGRRRDSYLSGMIRG